MSSLSSLAKAASFANPLAHPHVLPTSVVPRSCIRPAFKGQMVVDRDGLYELSQPGCFLFASSNVLNAAERESYLQSAAVVERRMGHSGFGPKPRAEVCYTHNGQPYKYSGKAHYTTSHPPHVEKLAYKLLGLVSMGLERHKIPNPYTCLSNAVDIVYSDVFRRGGSISAHKDDEQKWGLVLIFSLGQTRWLRVRDDDTRAFCNVKLEDNSLVAMVGRDFQTCFTHQVDKLFPAEKVGVRLSLNIRYLADGGDGSLPVDVAVPPGDVGLEHNSVVADSKFSSLVDVSNISGASPLVSGFSGAEVPMSICATEIISPRLDTWVGLRRSLLNEPAPLTLPPGKRRKRA